MINTITFVFPRNTEPEQDFFAVLLSLLKELPNTDLNKNGISLYATKPLNSFPKTSFVSKDILYPEIYFDETKVDIFQIKKPASKEKQKKSLLTISELYTKLEDHIIRIDHTGINIPSNGLSPENWELFVKKVAKETNMYKYPTGEPWQFIIPATEEEFLTDIINFSIGREPKFELVYDTYTSLPSIQIDIQTDLLQKEVEKLFPAPYGISFSGLETFFRAVYIQHEWVGLHIRFDIRFKNNDIEWTTGEWLVKEGGRI